MDNKSEAQRDFDRARNLAVWQTALGTLQGKNYDLVDYNEVRKRLSKTVNQLPVLKDIPISAIVGTVSRNADFTRTFLPKMEHDKTRWVNVRLANESMTGVPPIDVYQIGDVYFVLDGHHRVSIMKSYGAEYISAYVRVINPDVPLKPDDSPDEIILKTEKETFLAKTEIEKIIPDANLELKLPGEYLELLEHIETHRYFMGLDLKRDITNEESVLSWYENVYMPVIQVIRNLKIMDEFPEKTETELYLWIENNKAALADEYGGNVRDSALAWKLDAEYGRSKRNLIYQIKKNFMMLFSPNLSDWGIKTGDWRREIMQAGDNLSIERIMISVRDLDLNMDYLKSALRFAKNFDAWVGIVHVVNRSESVESDKVKESQQQVEELMQKENTHGKLFLLSGNLLRNLSERAFWSDISLFRMKYRPNPEGIKSIDSGWNSIFMRVPGPIFVTPDTFPERIDQVVLPFSQSSKSREAMYYATGLVKSTGSKLSVVIADTPEMDSTTALAEAKTFFSNHKLQVEFIVSHEEPVSAILKTAEEVQADLIVMGGYSRSFVQRFFKGSTVEKLLKVSNFPILVCK